MRKLVFFITTIFILTVSCNPQKRMQRLCSKCPSKEIITKADTFIQTLRDTSIMIQADSSNFMAVLRCDSLNNAYLKEINILSTKGIKTVVYFKHDTLRVVNTMDSVKVYMALKDKYKSDTQVKEIVITKEVKFIPWWIWTLWVLSIIITFYFCYKIFKR